MEKKDETPSPPSCPLRIKMMKTDSSASELSHSSSQGSSDDNEFPTSTSSWSISLIDKFGIRKVMKDPFEIVCTLWGLCILTDSEVLRIEEIVKVINFNQFFDCDSLEEMQYDHSIPYEEWVKEKFPQFSIKELKLFNEQCEEFGYFLFNTLQRLHQPKKKENQLPYEIEYQLLFEKFLKLFGFKVQSQPYLPTGRATIFGQEISSKTDILCSKWNDPLKILSICEEIHSTVHFQEKTTEVKRKSPEELGDFSPVKKKLRSAAPTLETVNEEASSSTGLVPGLSADVYAQLIGELLAYFESSVSPNGLIGMVVQKTNVLFTLLKINPGSYEKIRARTKPGSVKFDTTKYEEPILFYTKQFNYLNREDRMMIFKTLIAMRMIEVKAPR